MKYQSVMDLHTHTVASGHAYCTLREMARAASDKGLELLGYVILHTAEEFLQIDTDRTFHRKEDHGGSWWKGLGHKPAGNRNDHVFCSQKISGGTDE